MTEGFACGFGNGEAFTTFHFGPPGLAPASTTGGTSATPEREVVRVAIDDQDFIDFFESIP